MEHINTNSVISIGVDYLAENMKTLSVLFISIVTAYSPMEIFLHYDWAEWLPFLEVVKTGVSILAAIAATTLLILNYFKKKNENRRKRS